MSKWKNTNLHKKLNIKHGYPFKSKFFADDGDYIMLTPGNFFEKGGFKRQLGKEKFYQGEIPEEYIHKQGDLIVAMTEQAEGLLGSCAIVPDDNLYLHNQRLGLITVDDSEVDKMFIYHLFKTNHIRQQLRLTSSGSKVKHTSPERIYDLKVYLPPVRTQKKIVAVLSALDTKIELNNRINAELEAMAKTLYDYWFVQFDFPDENGKPYKLSGSKMVYNTTLKREIPEGWEDKKLGKVSKTSLGGTPSTKEPIYWEGANIPWLNSGEISNFPVISSEDYITNKGVNNSAAELLPKGSVVISIVRYIRPSILAIDAATNQSVVGIYETPILKHSFIYPLLVNDVPRLMSLRTGAQQPHINKGVVDTIPLAVPCEKVLKQYYRVAMPIYKKLMTIAFETKELTQLRDWLLPMLMNGQVTIK